MCEKEIYFNYNDKFHIRNVLYFLYIAFLYNILKIIRKRMERFLACIGITFVHVIII